MKLILPVLSLWFLVSGCSPLPPVKSAALFSMTSKAQPESVTSHQLPYLANITATNFQMVFPDAYYATNFNWFFEVAEDLDGHWRYPNSPQHPTESNWVIHLDGAQFIRARGVPN